MGDLLVVTGPPGAGKSTIAAHLADAFDPSVLVAGDAFFAFLRRGAIAPWLPESAAQNDVVTDAAAAATGRFARGPGTTVYDGVLGPWHLPRFLRSAGRGCSYAVLLPSVEECLARVATRSGHGFSDPDATRHMHAEFLAGVDTLEPRHVIANPAGHIDSTVARILSAHADGSLRLAPPPA